MCITSVPLAAVGHVFTHTPQPVQSNGEAWIANLNLPYLATVGFLASKNLIGEPTISSSVAR
jgi:hypothetical protein